MTEEAKPIENAKVEVTPLSPAAVVIGSLLGSMVFVVGVWMLYRHWKPDRGLLNQANDNDRENDDQPVTNPGTALGYFERRRVWHIPAAITMMVVGILIVFGVFIDPRIESRRFIIVWTSIGFAVFALLCMAGFDLLVTRSRFWRAQRLELQERRDRLAQDVADLRARKDQPTKQIDIEPRPPSSNGHQNGYHNGQH